MKEVFVLSKKNEEIKTVFDNCISAMRLMIKSGDVSVTVSLKKVPRTVKQNAYFHKLIALIAGYLGVNPEHLKREIKHKIGLYEQAMINGELITIIKSTADLNVKDFGVLIEETIGVCIGLNIKYPTTEYYGFKL